MIFIPLWLFKRIIVVIVCVFAPVTAIAVAPIQETAYYPESPTVNGRDIYWAEMPLDRIRRLSNGNVTTVWKEQGCGPTSVKRTAGGSYWVLCHLGHKVIRLSANFQKELEVTDDINGNRIMWPNDSTTDSKGRLFLSSSGIFSLEAPAGGYVVLVDTSGKAKRIAGPVRYANGLSFDENRKILYLSEHLARRILRLELDASYAVVRTRVFFDLNQTMLARPEFPLAGPDGQLLRKDGEIIVAEYGAGRLLRVSPKGSLIGQITVPMKFVTNLIQSPFHENELIVTGAFNNETFPMPGQVISISVAKLPGTETR